ncbi:MAG: ribonuclease HI, partial [Dongiaceae bacterium]
MTIHSDGGCEGNPGPGGWAAVLEFGHARKEISGGEPATTNNRMELRAAIEALARLKEPCAVDFYTDSEYLREGITSWVAGWKVRRWRTAERKPVKNADLWRELIAEAARHEVRWHWVKGHAGHVENERADRLAARGQREALEAAGVPVPPLPEPRRQAAPRV